MFDVVRTPAERALLEALNALGVPYLIVGMSAALLEGAPGTTQDLDLWFGRIDAERLTEAARRASGVYTPGLDSFEQELQGAHDYEIDGLPVRVLPLERVIVSKRAANRVKDTAQIPMLEAALAARQDSLKVD